MWLASITSAQLTEWLAMLRIENDEILVDNMNNRAVEKLAEKRRQRGKRG